MMFITFPHVHQKVLNSLRGGEPAYATSLNRTFSVEVIGFNFQGFLKGFSAV